MKGGKSESRFADRGEAEPDPWRSLSFVSIICQDQRVQSKGVNSSSVHFIVYTIRFGRQKPCDRVQRDFQEHQVRSLQWRLKLLYRRAYDITVSRRLEVMTTCSSA